MIAVTTQEVDNVAAGTVFTIRTDQVEDTDPVMVIFAGEAKLLEPGTFVKVPSVTLARFKYVSDAWDYWATLQDNDLFPNFQTEFTIRGFGTFMRYGGERVELTGTETVVIYDTYVIASVGDSYADLIPDTGELRITAE